jgi:hypothetical protein
MLSTNHWRHSVSLFIEEYKQLQHRIFMIREARYRGRSTWSWEFWELAEHNLIRKFNHKQGVDYAKLVL